MPGFILADPNKNEIIDDLPEAIRILLSERHGVEINVVPSEYVEQHSKAQTPWLVLPSEVKHIDPFYSRRMTQYGDAVIGQRVLRKRTARRRIEAH